MFLAHDVATARQAYQRLLVVLGDEHDEGGFPGAGLPDELVDSDLAEAKHRYLRAVWEDEPAETRAAAVIAAAEEVAWVGGEPSLDALEATRPEPLPDLASAVLLLDDRLGSAEDLLETAGPLGWRYEQHPGPVVVPILLVAASRAPPRDPPGRAAAVGPSRRGQPDLHGR